MSVFETLQKKPNADSNNHNEGKSDSHYVEGTRHSSPHRSNSQTGSSPNADVMPEIPKYGILLANSGGKTDYGSASNASAAEQETQSDLVAIYEGGWNPIDAAFEKLAEAGLVVIGAAGLTLTATADAISTYLDENPDVAAVLTPVADLLISGPDSLIGWGVLESRRGGNVDENSQARAAAQKIGEIIGRALTENEIQELHRAISKDSEYDDYWSVVILGVEMFGTFEDLRKIPRDKWPDGWLPEGLYDE